MTLDMTNNRVPYGLLTDEEKASLHEHKGGVEQYTSCGWRDHVMHKVSYHSCVTYRTVPLPAKTQDVIAWDRLPSNAVAVARDKNGEVHFYTDPDCYPEETQWLMEGGRCTRIDDFPGLVQIGTADWKESKVRRPRNAE